MTGVLLLTAGFLVAGGGFGDLWAEEGDKPKSDGPPPLVIDRSAPLLLDDAPLEKPDKNQGPMADNSACFVCHGNYEEEKLALVHAREEIGCVECHGESFAHRDDEDNVTPPDVMYWPERIDDKCQECHEEHDVPAREVLTRWQERCPEKQDFTQVACTDCHFQHRLARRTVRWEKKTGKLIVGDIDGPAKDAAEK
jgi:hypothetical protein